MNLPSTFTTYARFPAEVRRIVVDLKGGEIESVRLASTTGMPEGEILNSAELECARAWALKSLAWLKAEFKTSPMDLYLRGLEETEARLRESLSWFANDRLTCKLPSNVARAATDALSDVPAGICAKVRAAYMADLLDRMAEEMERQATEAVNPKPRPVCNCHMQPHPACLPTAHDFQCPRYGVED